MRAKIPKAWDKLSYADRDKLKAFAKEIAYEAAEKQMEIDGRIMLDIYIKMACLVLHDAFGFGERRLTRYIGNHKRLFHRQVKLVARGEQLQYLDKRMAEIFRKNGFPQEFIDSIIGKVNNDVVP